MAVGEVVVRVDYTADWPRVDWACCLRCRKLTVGEDRTCCAWLHMPDRSCANGACAFERVRTTLDHCFHCGGETVPA
jgi:hypothetical protein